jgi:hypothetical protein
MSYQRAWDTLYYFAFSSLLYHFYPREGKYGVFGRRIRRFAIEIKFKLGSGWCSIVRGTETCVNGEGCESFRKSVQNFFYTRTAGAPRQEGTASRAPRTEISN